VTAGMTEYPPAGELQFLTELSVEPVAAKLGLIAVEPRTQEGTHDRSFDPGRQRPDRT
jgi:hypothetical protein